MLGYTKYSSPGLQVVPSATDSISYGWSAFWTGLLLKEILRQSKILKAAINTDFINKQTLMYVYKDLEQSWKADVTKSTK